MNSTNPTKLIRLTILTTPVFQMIQTGKPEEGLPSSSIQLMSLCNTHHLLIKIAALYRIVFTINQFLSRTTSKSRLIRVKLIAEGAD